MRGASICCVGLELLADNQLATFSSKAGQPDPVLVRRWEKNISLVLRHLHSQHECSRSRGLMNNSGSMPYKYPFIMVTLISGSV